MFSAVLLTFFVVADPSVRKAAPEWPKGELRQLLMRAQAAADPNLSVVQKDEVLANLVADAYRIRRSLGESPEVFARRALKEQDPGHPNVRSGQWLLAVIRFFYDDLAKRCAQLAQFEMNRQDRLFLAAKAKEAAFASSQIAPLLQVVVEGLKGFYEPLPIAAGETPTKVGAMAIVRQGIVSIEGMDRMTFQNDQVPADAERTAGGSLKELYSAQKQYQITAEMLSRYETSYQKSRGHLRVVLPARAPSKYLNELVHAGLEAGMHTLHVMTMSKQGELGELRAMLSPPKAPKAPKRPKPTNVKKKGMQTKTTTPDPILVRCQDEEEVQLCVARIAHGRTQGEVLFRID